MRAATNRNPVYRVPRKSKDRALFSHFSITPLPGGCVSIACHHYEEYNKQKVKTFNPTKGRAHIVNQCKGIGVDVKRQLIQGTQAAKRRGEVFALSKSPTTTVADMRSNALASTKKRFNSRPIDSNYIDLSSPSASSISSVSASSPGPEAFGSERKHQPEGQPPIDAKRNFGPVVTQAEADKILIAEVKAIMHRGEPPGHLLDPYVKAGLVQRHPALWDYLPRH